MFEDMHHEDGRHETQDVSNKAGVKVRSRVAFETVVETEKKSDENARNHDVTESEHSEIVGA